MPPATGQLERYHAKRDFRVTAEPRGGATKRAGPAPAFVVQKHDASRLHWDFRLEHDGVLWSWAVPKGPSLDPADKRLAVHVEDHPLDYAGFAGTIPEGQYGAGTVERWDFGTWTGPDDPAAALRKGELKFTLKGRRLRGAFVLVRLKPHGREKTENWLLIKERDGQERPGIDAAALEQAVRVPQPGRAARAKGDPAPAQAPPARDEAAPAPEADSPPAPGARRGRMPRAPRPQLAQLVEDLPEEAGWLNEVKFDGYRLLLRIEDGAVQAVTRGEQDWTARLPAVVQSVAGLNSGDALLDAELVALRPDGVSSFAQLQRALSEKRDDSLYLYVFDLLHWRGWDLRGCALADRKALLRSALRFNDTVRFSDHLEGRAGAMRRQACAMGLEGIIAKRADAPYREGRGADWRKLKCGHREELVVLGWTDPKGTRTGLGALQMGFWDAAGTLHYAGGVGTGFDAAELRRLRRRLDRIAAEPPRDLHYADEPPERGIHWVQPELVAELQFAGWTGAGRIRQAVYLGLREDKAARDVVREAPGTDTPRRRLRPLAVPRILRIARDGIAAPREEARQPAGEPALSHPEKPLWPGITKADLALYWRDVAPHALPELAGRPLAVLRCPDGIAGQHFFQKHAMRGQPEALRAGDHGGAPYLVLDDVNGLIACAQLAAIELHAWGAREDDPDHPDRLVFDLDPGEGVGFDMVVDAAREVRARLKALGLESFCRTSGGKGLHVVVPIARGFGWDAVRNFCRGFAEMLSAEAPERYLSKVSKAARRGRILVDWLRNGKGATAVASFCPRARPGAGVATPLRWTEVKHGLDPQAFTLSTIRDRLKKQRRDPWGDWRALEQALPVLPARKRRLIR
ncbi:DNA ligase D [Teichococcus vastitatis]|uniref:DNA ligase (ATP) n=1 Tax=Teichococcus vastitatis TaxID=2307076 RepID=A0ABS9W095_9PROT|nr:DNA ligase D [Pseudoroseomonas vastitatis]MCI0752612.1 DNA ligase D [Pseudoroseomonas vastitatis]